MLNLDKIIPSSLIEDIAQGDNTASREFVAGLTGREAFQRWLAVTDNPSADAIYMVAGILESAETFSDDDGLLAASILCEQLKKDGLVTVELDSVVISADPLNTLRSEPDFYPVYKTTPLVPANAMDKVELVVMFAHQYNASVSFALNTSPASRDPHRVEIKCEGESFEIEVKNMRGRSSMRVADWVWMIKNALVE